MKEARDMPVEEQPSKFGRELRIAIWMVAFIFIARFLVFVLGIPLGEYSAAIATLAGALIGLIFYWITADAWRDGNEVELRLLKVMLLGGVVLGALGAALIVLVVQRIQRFSTPG